MKQNLLFMYLSIIEQSISDRDRGTCSVVMNVVLDLPMRRPFILGTRERTGNRDIFRWSVFGKRLSAMFACSRRPQNSCSYYQRFVSQVHIIL